MIVRKECDIWRAYTLGGDLMIIGKFQDKDKFSSQYHRNISQ